MNVICGTGLQAKKYPRVVAAIGVFDAVHRGHQKVIARAVMEARRIKGTSVVVTFDPHPLSVLDPGSFRGYVLTLEARLKMIGACGADLCCVIPFTQKFSQMSASDFVAQVLVRGLGVRKVIVGEDFCFGHGREGGFDLLTARGKVAGFDVEKVPTLKRGLFNIKTKLIKKYINDGDLPRLKQFLGRDYSFLSEVVSGDARGRRLGYPTANLNKENVIILPSGIYCVRVAWGRQKRNGVFYIGTRPTFRKNKRDLSLELHVLNYRGDLYGKKVEVSFLKKIRDDMKFSDEESLVLQIARDVVFAKKFFARKSLS